MRGAIKSLLGSIGMLGVSRSVRCTAKNCIKALRALVHLERVQFRISRSVRRLRKKERIRVAFLVVFDTVFHFERLYHLMVDDVRFTPFIVVIPQVNCGADWGEQQYQKVLKLLKERYGDNVIGYRENGYSIKVEKLCDICVVMNSYDALTMPQYGIAYLGARGIPIVDANYGYDGGMYYTKGFCGMWNLAYLWRFYCGTQFFYDLMCHLQKNLRLHGRIRYSGVVKMDCLDKVVERPRSRKRILLCPHHSIEGSSLIALSNFRQYAELFQQLPQKYADIDWVFRPHPLLKSSMMLHGGWTEENWDDYIERLCSNKNVQYIPDGDCYDMFVNSDAMIQDCSSFLGEYHYTGHPQCYMLKSEEHAKSQYMDWGLEMLSHTYKAFSEADIYHFVDDVVIDGNDVKKQARMVFVKNKMCYNYPHVNEWILDDITKAIWSK